MATDPVCAQRKVTEARDVIWTSRQTEYCRTLWPGAGRHGHLVSYRTTYLDTIGDFAGANKVVGITFIFAAEITVQ